MEIQHNTKITEWEADTKHHPQETKEPISKPSSPYSSPSHEFSFTLSLLSSTTNSPAAIDLTPADDIFFHGHLLPLQLLPNPSVSPRSSTNSMDSFIIPTRELQLDDDKPHDVRSCICSKCDRTQRHSFNSYEYSTRRNFFNMNEEEFPTKEMVKAKSFSLFGRARRRKEGGECEDKCEKQKRKVRFDVSHFLKKYMTMFSKGRREDVQFRKQPCSFSGRLGNPSEGRRDLGGRREEFSAPASMWTSPSNSGKHVSRHRSTPSSDSTMEELQDAIQAAIAHCKNSIAVV